MNDAVPYWLWLGPVLDEDTMITRRAVSTAAHRWQKGLIEALRSGGRDVSVLSYVPEPVWPRGELLPRAESAPDSRVLAYVNAPVLREPSLARSHRRGIAAAVGLLGAPEALVTYNLQRAYLSAAREARARFGIPWIAVVADLADEGALRDSQLGGIAECDGAVFLSWKEYESAGSRSRLHLDGGINGVERTVGNERAILYTGAMTAYGGVEHLIEAFLSLGETSWELWLCGKGAEALRIKHPRVRVFGLITEEQLQSLSARAAVFANPRPTDLPASDSNFPSKVLEYLRHRRPVVSTWTRGLSPEYRAILVVSESSSPAALADGLRRAVSMTDDERVALASRIEVFLETRLWRQQAVRLRDWISREVLR